MFEPDRNMPDEYGFFYHPDLPVADEGESIAPPMAALGYECAFVCFDDDADDERVEAYNEGDPCVKAWAPTVPDGDGWILVAKYGTEDGPYAMFARKSRQSSDLWAIHIPGPDEYHAAPSEEVAQAMAKQLNEDMARLLAERPITPATPSIASVTASVVPWPSDAKSHAKALIEFDASEWGIEQKPDSLRKVYLVPRDDGSFEQLDHCPHGCGPDDVAVAYVPAQNPEGGDRELG